MCGSVWMSMTKYCRVRTRMAEYSPIWHKYGTMYTGMSKIDRAWDYIGLYRVRPGMAQYIQICLNKYLSVLGHTRPYIAILYYAHILPCWTILCYIDQIHPYCPILGYTGLYWAILRRTWQYSAILWPYWPIL